MSAFLGFALKAACQDTTTFQPFDQSFSQDEIGRLEATTFPTVSYYECNLGKRTSVNPTVWRHHCLSNVKQA
jgi:hypothetical protein